MSSKRTTTGDTATKAAAAPPPSDRELVISHIIDAPRARVFEAWTRQLPQWWGPHGMTTPVTFEDHGGKTKYTARALHWTIANREKHEQMGFHHGWGESLDRLVALVTRA